MIDYLSLPVGPNIPELINAVVEIPLGSKNKYEYGKTLHVFRLDRRLYSAVHFPEYVMGGGSSNYMFLVLAADQVLNEKH